MQPTPKPTPAIMSAHFADEREKALILEAAKKAGMTPSAYIRKVMLAAATASPC